MAIQKIKRAFTLVELLVVISIIALLLAVLMPALSKARKQGKIIICKTNMRQLNMAMRLYAEDNKDKTPYYSFADGEYWFAKISKYQAAKKEANHAVNLKTGYCPEATILNESATHAVPYGKRDRAWLWRDGTTGSFGINMWLCPDGDWSPPKEKTTDPTPIGKIDDYYTKFGVIKGDVPVFCDSIWVGQWPKDTDLPPQSLDGESSDLKYGMSRIYIDRHSMAIDIAFADLSTKRVQIKDLWQYKWHRNFKIGPMPKARTSK